MTPSPVRRHQRVVGALHGALLAYEKLHGGEVYAAPMDVFFSDRTVVEPDVLFLRPEHVDITDPDKIVSVPDVVVEVSSPATRRRDLTIKRELYERSGVPEYWFVDLDAEQVEVHVLRDGGYARPEILRSGETLTSEVLSGFALELSTILEGPRLTG